MSGPNPPPLAPSELGTKSYWDETYTTDLSSLAHPSSNSSRPPSPPEGWFADVNASSKVVRHLSLPALDLNRTTTTFLDLGTGNGELLFLLREKGFEGRMCGVDYSERSVELCTQLARQRGEKGVEFRVWDVLGDEELEGLQEWDVVLDKGTFDAVSLSGDAGERERVEEKYVRRSEGLVRKGGLLVLTSCNWTEEELVRWFCVGALEKIGRIEYPVFKFGGKSGQSVCSVVFKHK